MSLLHIPMQKGGEGLNWHYLQLDGYANTHLVAEKAERKTMSGQLWVELFSVSNLGLGLVRS